jgi:hypothetical protein
MRRGKGPILDQGAIQFVMMVLAIIGTILAILTFLVSAPLFYRVAFSVITVIAALLMVIRHRRIQMVLGAVLVAAIFLSVGVYISPRVGRSSSDVAAASASTTKTLTVSIDKPDTGFRTVNEKDEYSGSVTNLQENQLVWLFNQQLTHANNPTAPASAIYADSGPCDVRGDRWTCKGIIVGEPKDNRNAAGTYRVWVSIIDPKTAFRLVESLRNCDDAGHIPDIPEPPNVGAIDHMDVVRQ